jgi:hypothetical protein
MPTPVQCLCLTSAEAAVGRQEGKPWQSSPEAGSAHGEALRLPRGISINHGVAFHLLCLLTWSRRLPVPQLVDVGQRARKRRARESVDGYSLTARPGTTAGPFSAATNQSQAKVSRG